MTKAVIFDLDGTLADTILDIAGAVNASLSRRGLPLHDIETYKLMVGKGFAHLVRQAVPYGFPVDGTEEIRAEASAYYAAHPLDRTRAYPGVPALLAALAAVGLPRAVLSNKPQALVDLVVAGLFPQAGFAVVRGEGPGFPRKPDPTQALDLARILGLSPGEICYLGDSDVDMETAHNAGMLAVGAAWGFRGPGELAAAGAQEIIDAPLATSSTSSVWPRDSVGPFPRTPWPR